MTAWGMASSRCVAAVGTAGKPRLAKVTSTSLGVISNLRTEPRAVGIVLLLLAGRLAGHGRPVLSCFVVRLRLFRQAELGLGDHVTGCRNWLACRAAGGGAHANRSLIRSRQIS